MNGYLLLPDPNLHPATQAFTLERSPIPWRMPTKTKWQKVRHCQVDERTNKILREWFTWERCESGPAFTQP